VANNSLDLVITGLGNQPLAFACFVLARMAQNQGMDVQILQPQGADATAYVRIAQKAERRAIGQGEANILLGLDPVAAMKALPLLSKQGLAVINMPDQLTDQMLESALPDVKNPLALLEEYRVERRDALSEAKKAGLPMVAVTILLGMLSKHLPFSAYDWQHAIGSSVPRKVFAANMDAFLSGRGVNKIDPAPQRSLIDQSETTKKDDECSETTM
jgi:Pyruvate/2-oxoacid:ferredoxin oxidoreductase gamma subunit